MMLQFRTRMGRNEAWQGFTLMELIVATAIMCILVAMAVPVTTKVIKRERERELATIVDDPGCD